MKKFTAVLIMIFFNTALSDNISDFPSYFAGKTGCFMLYNLNQNILVSQYNIKQCKKEIPPQSTFKIPLSLMAFDQNIITQNTIFKWSGKETGEPQWNWNHNQTPKTWLNYSVIWVSQKITHKLGMKKIKHYLDMFNYGNQDFSGDPAKNNGLEKAWLSSSLKISANEQLSFLKNFIMRKLAVSQAAVTYTKENLYLETSPEGWKLYGKTGTSFIPAIGWFIGFIEKSGQTYIFVTNLTESSENIEVTGTKAKEITQRILTEMKLF